jgi:hypothetical protein
MVFNSKQLEELENIHDSTGAFEEEADDESFGDEVGGEAAMDWRRGLIEEAAESVKRARSRPVEPHLTYAINSMLFDRDVRRFARVQRSVPGYLKIIYLSGGDREFGTLDVTMYLREHGASKRVSELSEQLGMSDMDVISELDRLNIIPVEEPEEGEAEAAPEPVPPPIPPFMRKKAPVAPVEEEEEEEQAEAEPEEEEVGELDADDDDDDDRPARRQPLPPLPAGKGRASAPVTLNRAPARPAAPPPRAATRAAVPPTRPVAAKVLPPIGKAAKPAGKLNPIDDPNGYIKAMYQELSNRDLAKATGLSEHTIRRKLGEWGLKRKKDG